MEKRKRGRPKGTKNKSKEKSFESAFLKNQLEKKFKQAKNIESKKEKEAVSSVESEQQDQTTKRKYTKRKDRELTKEEYDDLTPREKQAVLDKILFTSNNKPLAPGGNISDNPRWQIGTRVQTHIDHMIGSKIYKGRVVSPRGDDKYVRIAWDDGSIQWHAAACIDYDKGYYTGKKRGKKSISEALAEREEKIREEIQEKEYNDAFFRN